MDFIELTNPEYKRSLGRLIWRTPIARLLRSKWAIPFLLFCLALGTLLTYTDDEIQSLFSNLGIGYEVGMPQALLGGFLFVFALVLLGFCVYLFCLPMRRRPYVEYRKKFISKVNQLNSLQTKTLLSEYPSRKKIEIYYDKKKKTTGSVAIYVTDHFLFIPGLLLVPREEVDEIKVSELYWNISSRSLSPIRQYFLDTNRKGAINVKVVTRFEFISEGTDPIYSPMDYDYSVSPETAERVMAWFWQCDPNDPGLKERVGRFVEKEYS